MVVATVDGFNVAYTRRGSWKINRSFRGKVIDEIPVAWTRDHTPGSPSHLIIWFKDESEAGERLNAKRRFIAALSEKKSSGASAKDILRLLEVEPIEAVIPTKGVRSGLRCVIVGKCPSIEA